MDKCTVRERPVISLLIIAALLLIGSTTANAYEGYTSFERGIPKARAVVLTEVRKNPDGKLALFVIKTLKGHPVPMQVLVETPPPESQGRRFIHLLDDYYELFMKQWSHGTVHTLEVSEGWIALDEGAKTRERLADFERRMAAQNRAEKATIDAVEGCFRDPAGGCPGTPDERRRQIQGRAAHETLALQFSKAAPKCKLDQEDMDPLRTGVRILADGRVEVQGVNVRLSLQAKTQECLQREFSTMRIPFWKDSMYVFELSPFFEVWRLQQRFRGNSISYGK